MNVQLDHREASDRYHREVLRLGCWRVVICRDGLQAILQRHTRASRPDGGVWEGVSYCATRAALIRLWTARTGDDGTALVELLPEAIARVDREVPVSHLAVGSRLRSIP